MSNLFFIHTPLQLMIAQMIIEQENLKDNVMLCGYVDDNRHFLQIYEIARIDEMWMAIEPMDDVARWALFSRKNPFLSCLRAYKRFCYICRIIKKHHVGTLFLGDMWNGSCQLAAMSCHRKGLKICFFEDGCGHYKFPYCYGHGGGLIDKAYALLIDILYYLPMYGVKMGYISYWKGLTINDIPMDARYSVVPFYHEKYDILITTRFSISEKLVEFINKEVSKFDQKKKVLLITSPLYGWTNEIIEKDEEIYVHTIVDRLMSIDKDSSVHIKFHPREKDYIRKKILIELKKRNINYILLGSEVNIPVEYYLQYIHYEEIVMFLSSTYFYNGYLFPRMRFVSLLENYYNNCLNAGSHSVCFLEPLLKEIPKE